MRSLIKTACFIVLFCVSIVAVGQPVAKVIDTKGKATAKRNGKVRIIKRGASLSVGDEIQTQGNAEAKLRYNNGTLVTLTNTANYRILKYAPQQEVEIEAELNTGQAHIVTEGNLRKKEILKTKVVAMAIIGTVVTADTGNCSILQIDLTEGKINIDGIDLIPGIYNVSLDDNGKVNILPQERGELPGQAGNTGEVMDSNAVEDLGQLVAPSIALEAAGPASIPETPTATLEIICP